MGFQAGVAAGLVALAELSIETKNRQRAIDLLDEAESMSQAQGASGIMAIVNLVRLQLKESSNESTEV